MKIPQNTKTFEYYNANPYYRKTSDCVVRAICTALGQDYNQTVRELTELWLETGYEFSEPKYLRKILKKNIKIAFLRFMTKFVYRNSLI